MTGKNLSDAIGNISDKYLMEVLDGFVSPSEVIEVKKSSVIRRIAAIVLAACLVLALSVTAFASGWFGLDTITRRIEGNTVAAVSAEADAAVEWMEYKSSHVGAISEDSEWDILNQYGAYSDADKAALKVIAEKHGLKLFTELDYVYSVEELAEKLGTSPFLPELADNDNPGLSLGSGAVYGHNSVWSFIGNAELANGKKLFYDFYSAADGYFLPPAATLVDKTGFESENYDVSGAELTLCLGTARSYILGDLGCGTVTIFIRSGSKSVNSDLSTFGISTLTMDDLREFADSIDFTALANGMK